MKRFINYLLIIAILSILSSCTNTYLGRYVFWNFPKANDYQKMPFKTVNKSTSSEFNFGRNIQENLFEGMEFKFDNINYNDQIDKFLKATATNAFVIIKNDTVIYEKYLNNNADSTFFRSFSVTKSVISSLIGIAIDKNFIHSIDDKISDYIPDLEDSKYNDVTIKSLLNMNSGFAFHPNFFPWNDLPKTYLNPNIRSLTLKKVKKIWPAETKFEYNNYNTFLLGMVLENASNQSISRFFEKYLWTQIGTSNKAFFTIDSKKYKFEKVETGLSATAIDLAKFGRLYLNKGMWNGQQIIPKHWANLSSSIDTQYINKSNYYSNRMLTRNIAYHNAWWQQYDNNQQCEAFWASGFLGQIIWIYPEKKIIIVRLGRKSGGIEWNKLLANIAERI